MKKTLAILGCLCLAPALAANVTAPPPVYGLWQNPRATVRVRIGACGQMLCGTVAAATSSAQADARAAGVNPLIGVQLLQDYHQVDTDRWAGRVFVPDMGRTFSSRIVQVRPDTLQISGCLIGGMLCKSQLWTRV